jgi:hypothetical protein
MNICAIFRNEGLYIREWLEFHLLVGAQKFYLYQNNSDDDYLPLLQPYIDAGIVDLTQWPMARPSQLAAYQHCIDRLRGQPAWVAFIDCDEFLFSPRFGTVDEALRSLPRSAIGVNWMCFGGGGQQEWRDAPVIERFVWRPRQSEAVNTHIKSVIYMEQNVRTGGDPHFFSVEHGTFNENAQPVSGPFSPHSSSLLRVNHYCTKSYGEWITRSKLGKPDRAMVEINPQSYWGMQPMEVEDRDIQRFLPALKERLALP